MRSRDHCFFFFYDTEILVGGGEEQINIEGNSFQISWKSIGKKRSVTEPVSGRARSGCVETVWRKQCGRRGRGGTLGDEQ